MALTASGRNPVPSSLMEHQAVVDEVPADQHALFDPDPGQRDGWRAEDLSRPTPDCPRQGHRGRASRTPSAHASKSVSLVWALGSDADARVVEEALYAARDEVERYLEANACFVRRGHAGAVVEPGKGFLGAVFLHRTSRLGDPGLHLHRTVCNVTEGPDGRRTALDGKALYRERYMTARRTSFRCDPLDIVPLGQVGSLQDIVPCGCLM